MIVTFETAKKAKEKGFDGPVCEFYTPEGEMCHMVQEDLFSKINGDPDFASRTAAPEQHDLAKWLRDEKGKYIYVFPEFYTTGINFNWQVLWYLPKDQWTEHNIHDGTYVYGDNGEYPTYEQALEAGLQKALELI